MDYRATYRNQLYALISKSLGRRLGYVSGDTTNSIFLGQHRVSKNGFDNRATLNASGSEDSQNL